jgi:hypothetical protein
VKLLATLDHNLAALGVIRLKLLVGCFDRTAISPRSPSLKPALRKSRPRSTTSDQPSVAGDCALFDTLIADTDGVYDPPTYNDRLLLGLKGTIVGGGAPSIGE